MRCNVIRPGYTFGNPVADGAPIQPDQRFVQIVERALAGREIRLASGEGAQLVWVGDLARLYQAVLDSERSREIYLGLAAPFVTWQAVAEQAIALTGSKSPLVLEGEPGPPCRFDPSKIRRHFGLELESAERLTEHLRYLIRRACAPTRAAT